MRRRWRRAPLAQERRHVVAPAIVVREMEVVRGAASPDGTRDPAGIVMNARNRPGIPARSSCARNVHRRLHARAPGTRGRQDRRRGADETGRRDRHPRVSALPRADADPYDDPVRAPALAARLLRAPPTACFQSPLAQCNDRPVLGLIVIAKRHVFLFASEYPEIHQTYVLAEIEALRDEFEIFVVTRKHATLPCSRLDDPSFSWRARARR